MDFADSAQRGYGWKADQPRDIELKMLLKVIDPGSDQGLSLGSSTGRHSGDGCCSGFNYMFNIFLGENPVKFRFRKEMWHVNYDDDPKTGQWTHADANFRLEDVNDRWIGFAFCRYDLKDFISNGEDAVACEAWINPDPEDNPNNWIMMKRTIDTGGWGDGGDDCGGDNSQVGTWSNGQFRIKSDSGVVIKFKNCSLREIDPTLSFDDTPETPPDPPTGTTTIQGSFKFQNDVNTLRSQSSCAGSTPEGGGGGSGGSGGSGGLTRFYSQPPDNNREMGDSDLWQHRTRITERALSSSSGLHGKLIKQVDVPLKKAGSPASTPTVNCKIYSLGGSIIYESPTHIDPSTLTTSFVYKTFDFSTNTHVMVTGDRIGVHYEGTSETDYIMVGYIGTDVLTQTQYEQYEAGSWEPKSRELAMDLYE